MSFHVPNPRRICTGMLRSTRDDGNNGAFSLRLRDGTYALVIASDGGGWEHVSVTIPSPTGADRCPTWEEMCEVKSVFWDDEDIVIQYHPAKRDYRNYHSYCLHMWRPIDVSIPVPPPIMVAP